MADIAQTGPESKPHSLTVVAVMPSVLANDGAWRAMTVKLGWTVHECTDTCLALAEAWALHKAGERIGVLLIEPTRWLVLATRLSQALADHVRAVQMFTFDDGTLLDHAGEPVAIPNVSPAESAHPTADAMPTPLNPNTNTAGSRPPVLIETPNGAADRPAASAPSAGNWRITREEIDMLLHDRPAQPGGGSP